jgi:PEP-CTERM motif
MKDLIRRSRYGGTALLGFLLWFPVPADAVPSVFSVGGNNTPASIQGTVDAFRAALGDPNNANNPGPLPGGRREINWDGGGATDGTPAITPFLVFQNLRGGTFTTPGSGLTQTPISGGTVDIAPLLPGLQGSLADINPTYATTFSTFSPVRLFVPLDSNITDAFFFLPGTNGGTPATVSGFGAVFTDVDTAGLTTLQFFDVNNQSLGIFPAPIGTVPDGSLSFLGVTFTTEEIARVRITTGNAPLGPNDNPAGGVEVVAMDDFLYAEPQQAIPEASTLVLMGFGMIGLAALARKRKDVTTS